MDRGLGHNAFSLFLEYLLRGLVLSVGNVSVGRSQDSHEQGTGWDGDTGDTGDRGRNTRSVMFSLPVVPMWLRAGEQD